MFYKLMKLTTLLVLISTPSLSETQYLWWGGPGHPGPVGGWQSNFHQCSSIVWWEFSVVFLEKDPVEIIDETCSWPSGICEGDLDEDGDYDLIGAIGGTSQWGGDKVVWWENNPGSGSNWESTEIGHNFDGAISVVSADINGDGFLDVVGGAYFSGEISWWENTDGSGDSWVKHNIQNDYTWLYEVDSADLDGDGDQDILCESWLYDEVAWWENLDGTGGSWMKHTIVTGLLGTSCAVACDLDNDGHTDVLTNEVYGDKVLWYQNVNGSGLVWQEQVISSESDLAHAVDAGDVDSDGDLDVVAVTGSPKDEIVLFLNDGSGTSWTEVFVAPAAFGSCETRIADMDGDNDCDIVGSFGGTGGEIYWFENTDGSALNWQSHKIVDVCNDPNTVCPVDLNGDGRLDLAVALSAGQQVLWWDLQNEYPESGWLESTILFANPSPDYLTFMWDSSEPVGTSVSFQIRVSDDASSMGEWSDLLTTTPVGTDSVISDGDSYFQYRMILETTDGGITPIVNSVSIIWANAGVEDEGSLGSAVLSVPVNPASGSVSVRLTLTEQTELALSVYDLSGRTVSSTPERNYPEGISEMFLDELQPGIYLCRVDGDGLSETVRLAVID